MSIGVRGTKRVDNKTRPDEPIIVFFLTSPGSGSTALAKLLATDPKVCLLSPWGEGKSLVPEFQSKTRWNPRLKFDAQRLKRIWLSRFNDEYAKDNRVSIVVEKSPPNMVRIESLLSLFDTTLCFALIRNPYASVANVLRRAKLARRNEAELLPTEAVATMATKWCRRASILKQKCDQLHLQVIHYEDFCAEPKRSLGNLTGLLNIIDSIDYCRELSVKDYSERNVIKDFNASAISTASAAELSQMTDVFKDHLPLLTYFGYRIGP